MEVRVELYGRLRDAGLGDQVELTLPPYADVSDLLKALASRLGAAAALVEGCALADETEVLSSEARVPEGRRLALLPPVCGG